MPSDLGLFVIPDDSGILALLDASQYQPFIGPDWTLVEILGRFRESMARQCMLVWSPGCEGNWRISASLGPAPASAIRHASGSIRVSGNGLHLVSYDSLTMAAQFPDQQIPPSHEAGNLITLPSGLYSCCVSQFFPPEDFETEAVFNQTTAHYSLSFQASTEALPPWENVAWLRL